MSFSVNTNYEANSAIRLLDRTTRRLSIAQAHVNGGFRVGGAKDNASTFAIAQGMRGDVAAFRSTSEALTLGEATVNVALAAASRISDTLNEMKAKITSAQASNVDRDALQRDLEALSTRVTTAAKAAQFNGVNLLDGSAAVPDPDLKIMSSLNRFDSVSAPRAEYITVRAEQLDAISLGLNGLNVKDRTVELVFSSDAAFADNDQLLISAGGVDYTFEFMDDPTQPSTAAQNIIVDVDSSAPLSQNLAALRAAMSDHGFSTAYNRNGNLVVSHSSGDAVAGTTFFSSGQVDGYVTGAGDPSTAMVVIENALTMTRAAVTRLGGSATRIQAQQSFVESLSDTLVTSVGTLVDADLAEESAMLQALQTKQQLGLQALSIVNRQPATVLALFR